MLTNKKKVEIIKEGYAELSRPYSDELLIIIAEELIKMNEYLERDSIKF